MRKIRADTSKSSKICIVGKKTTNVKLNLRVVQLSSEKMVSELKIQDTQQACSVLFRNEKILQGRLKIFIIQDTTFTQIYCIGFKNY